MFSHETLNTILFYVPLSLLGLWRWTYWVVQKVCARLYKPDHAPWPEGVPFPRVSVVTPVYNEDPDTFRQAVRSWVLNGADEIVAVIDKSNTAHIVEFERKYVSKKHDVKTRFKMIVTPKPGKRAALCDGIEAATGDIIALVDSDTIWGEGVLSNAVPKFKDPNIGGVTVTQRIQNPDNVSNVLFDMLLWSRYREEVPFLLALGKTINTLSGRTAFYRREAIFHEMIDNIHHLRHEFFLGTRGISGDDKRLTHLIVQQGWHTSFVENAVVYTPGLGSIRAFLKQRLRWTRNSWRADLRAVKQRWVFRHPALSFFMIDRFISPFFMLIGPVVLTISIAHKDWLFVGILIAWWFLSRFIKANSYFRKYPKRLVYLPAFIIYGYVNAFIKIYALATLIEHSWATRWHKTRAKRKKILRKAFTVSSGIAAVALLLSFIAYSVITVRRQIGLDLPDPVPIDTSAFAASLAQIPEPQKDPPTLNKIVSPLSVKTYQVQKGDTMEALSEKFGMDVVTLKEINGIRNAKKINEGQTLFYFDGGQL